MDGGSDGMGSLPWDKLKDNDDTTDQGKEYDLGTFL